MIGQNSKDLIYLNPDCLDSRKRNAGNIIKKRFNAKGNQMFKCKTCGVRFPETKGMVFYNRHLTEEQIIMTYKLLLEKNGVREIERIKEIHRDTVSDVIEDLARHAREVTDYLITNVGLTQIQVDEMWSFVKKSLLLEMQGDIGRSSGSLPVLHQFYPNPFSIDD
jgi:transposase-like protein